MPKYAKNDITGKRFSKLLALRFIPDDSEYSKFLFKCDCGVEKIIMAQSVLRGATVSCGCTQKEIAKKQKTIHGHNSPKSRSPTYTSWASMMDRCEWGGHKVMFARYNGKGIRVCAEWHDFRAFLRDMGERPVGTSIDRIKNDEGYSKNNCKWSTRYEQSMNTSRTIKVLIDGIEVKVKEFCEEKCISMKAVRSRAVRRGFDYVAALRSFGIDCEPMPNKELK